MCVCVCVCVCVRARANRGALGSPSHFLGAVLGWEPSLAWQLPGWLAPFCRCQLGPWLKASGQAWKVGVGVSGDWKLRLAPHGFSLIISRLGGSPRPAPTSCRLRASPRGTRVLQASSGRWQRLRMRRVAPAPPATCGDFN